MATQTGTVTVLFTDLVGSTQILERLGDDEADALRRRHFALLRATVADHGGHEVKTLGDGLMVCFPSVLNALRCAVAMQEAVRQFNESGSGPPIRIRIGLHAGETAQEEGDYFGTPVVVAKRLCDLARGGQILVSDVVRRLVGRRGAFEFHELGSLNIKGLSTPVPSVELLWDPSAPPMTVAPEEVPLHEAPRRSFAGSWIVAAGAVALALVGLAYVAASGERDDDAPRERAAAAPAPASPAGPTWQRVDGAGAFGGPGDQQIYRLAVAGPGVVAVGFDRSEGDADAAVWLSDDALEWRRAGHLEVDVGGAGDQLMYGVAEGSLGLVAVGGERRDGDLDAAVWGSTDGDYWERIAHREELFGGEGDQLMTRVIEGGEGLIAVGYDESGGDQDAAVWTSADGETWERIAAPERVLGGRGEQQMRSVAAAGDLLVGVGFDTRGGDADAAVWVLDEAGWTRVAHDDHVFGGPYADEEMVSVAAGGPGFVAVGHDATLGDADTALWVSPDGLSWKRVPHDLEVFGGPGRQIIQGVYSTEFGLVAVGVDGSGGGLDAAVWTSDNGEDWTRVERDEDVFGGDGFQNMKTVVSFGDLVVAAGWAETEEEDFDAAVWVRRAAPTPAGSPS